MGVFGLAAPAERHPRLWEKYTDYLCRLADHFNDHHHPLLDNLPAMTPTPQELKATREMARTSLVNKLPRRYVYDSRGRALLTITTTRFNVEQPAKRKRSQNVTAEARSKMQELEASGKTRKAIAEATGYHPAVVTRQLGKKPKNKLDVEPAETENA